MATRQGESVTSSTNTLEYASPKRGRRWKWVVLPFLLGVVATVGYLKGPGAWQRARLLYWQHRCMTYTAPPDQVVYEEAMAGPAADVNPPAAPGLVSSPNAGFLGLWSHTRPVSDWRAFSELRGTIPSTTQAVLFLHERRTASGITRLVFVTIRPWTYDQPELKERLRWTVIHPGSVNRDPTSSTWEPLVFRLGIWQQLPFPNQRLRLFAGQPDLADPSHFTIGYELDGSRGTIDGWLRDNEPLPAYIENGGYVDGDGIPDFSVLPLLPRPTGDVVYVALSVRDGPAVPVKRP